MCVCNLFALRRRKACIEPVPIRMWSTHTHTRTHRDKMNYCFCPRIESKRWERQLNFAAANNDNTATQSQRVKNNVCDGDGDVDFDAAAAAANVAAVLYHFCCCAACLPALLSLCVCVCV